MEKVERLTAKEAREICIEGHKEETLRLIKERAEGGYPNIEMASGFQQCNETLQMLEELGYRVIKTPNVTLISW